jgi:hypothetical protein
MDPAMQAHLMMMMASQQLIADAQRQRVQHQEEELKRQQAMDAMAKELEQDTVIRPNFDRFDKSNSTGGSDGTITAEECVGTLGCTAAFWLDVSLSLTPFSPLSTLFHMAGSGRPLTRAFTALPVGTSLRSPMRA